MTAALLALVLGRCRDGVGGAVLEVAGFGFRTRHTFEDGRRRPGERGGAGSGGRGLAVPSLTATPLDKSGGSRVLVSWCAA